MAAGGANGWRMDGNTVSVARIIKAPPGKVFAPLADAGKHASFDGSESGEPRRANIGAFVVRRDIRDGDAGPQGNPVCALPHTNTVVEYEPDRRIAWKTTGWAA